MKIYQGIPNRPGEGGFITVLADGYALPLDPSLKLRNHSPTGFSHGYNGSGPAQLALALLLDALGDPAMALRNYQAFKEQIVAAWPQDQGWRITSEQVRRIVQRLEDLRGMGHSSPLRQTVEVADVEWLTELQPREPGDGPWCLFVYSVNGYHHGGVWFGRGMPTATDEISLANARGRADEAIRQKREVRVTDAGDCLVFHALEGRILHGADFWKIASGETVWA